MGGWVCGCVVKGWGVSGFGLGWTLDPRGTASTPWPGAMITCWGGDLGNGFEWPTFFAREAGPRSGQHCLPQTESTTLKRPEDERQRTDICGEPS